MENEGIEFMRKPVKDEDEWAEIVNIKVKVKKRWMGN